ncbi:MAG: hypothetical protein ACD_51C00068G0003 [uncultured bacterium]|nr:MAG: hypothetical protein ACD_51C00068G0003 [uncultured bacterium]
MQNMGPFYFLTKKTMGTHTTQKFAQITRKPYLYQAF